MKRQEVVDFILNEVKRLNEEEHIHDLNKAGRYEELSNVECKVTRKITEYLLENDLELRAEEIPEGWFLGIVIWANSLDIPNIIVFDDKFIEKFILEGDDLAKSIAYKSKKENVNIINIYSDEFFDASGAQKYDTLKIQ